MSVLGTSFPCSSPKLGDRSRPQRGRLALDDRWQPTRYLTVAGSLGLVSARALDGGPPIVGPSWVASAAWDATHDGRTAARLRASATMIDPHMLR